MPDAMDSYLNRVMSRAALAGPDAVCVRGELKEHLCELCDQRGIDPQNTKEALAMFAKEFGDPGELGASISRSRGRLGTYLKKKVRRLPLVIGIAAVLALGIRATVAEAFKVGGDGVSPILMKGNRCLVNKLSSSFTPSDIIVYRPADHPERRYLAVVKEVDSAGDLKVTRNNVGTFTVERSRVVGKVFLSTR